jgi:hypothetical protein
MGKRVLPHSGSFVCGLVAAADRGPGWGIGEAMENVRNGRTYGEEDFMARVQERLPRKSSA